MDENSIPLYTDNTRNAKKFKVLPHRYLQDYEYSIFIDGNMYVVGNVDELIDKSVVCNVIASPFKSIDEVAEPSAGVNLRKLSLSPNLTAPLPET